MIHSLVCRLGCEREMSILAAVKFANEKSGGRNCHFVQGTPLYRFDNITFQLHPRGCLNTNGFLTYLCTNCCTSIMAWLAFFLPTKYRKYFSLPHIVWYLPKKKLYRELQLCHLIRCFLWSYKTLSQGISAMRNETNQLHHTTLVLGRLYDDKM